MRFLVLICVAGCLNLGMASAGPIGHPYMKGKAVKASVINPATLRVWVRVKNIGTEKGKPQCTVTARDASYTYYGFDIFYINKVLKPGKKITGWGNLTITNEGAAYVTKVKAKCETQ